MCTRSDNKDWCQVGAEPRMKVTKESIIVGVLLIITPIEPLLILVRFADHLICAVSSSVCLCLQWSPSAAALAMKVSQRPLQLWVLHMQLTVSVQAENNNNIITLKQTLIVVLVASSASFARLICVCESCGVIDHDLELNASSWRRNEFGTTNPPNRNWHTRTPHGLIQYLYMVARRRFTLFWEYFQAQGPLCSLGGRVCLLILGNTFPEPQ